MPTAQTFTYYKFDFKGRNFGKKYSIYVARAMDSKINYGDDGMQNPTHTDEEVKAYFEQCGVDFRYCSPFLYYKPTSQKTMYPKIVMRQSDIPSYWEVDTYDYLPPEGVTVSFDYTIAVSTNMSYPGKIQVNLRMQNAASDLNMNDNYEVASLNDNYYRGLPTTAVIWMDTNARLQSREYRAWTNANGHDDEIKVDYRRLVDPGGTYAPGMLLSLAWGLRDAGILDDLEVVPDSDPYEPGGTSTTGGGTGTFDLTSDTIGVPALPTLSAVDTGLVTVFAPNATQAKALANFLWDMSVDWDSVKKVISEPLKTILGFSIIPYTPDTGTAQTVKLGNKSTGVAMPPVTNQYKEIDCGELAIQEFWGSYLDYSPYTKTQLYLPFLVIVPIDIDDVMNHTLKVVYHCDCLTGACVAYVLSDGSQIATYVGQLSANIPLSSSDYANTINGLLGIAGNGLSMLVSGGATAASAVPGMAANAINALKPNISKSGALSGTGGIMGNQYPFLIAQRPRQCIPADYNSYGGYPSYITASLGSLTGYTKVSDIHLQIPNATDAERAEIEAALKAGVLL